jgi:hypothetical protein
MWHRYKASIKQSAKTDENMQSYFSCIKYNVAGFSHTVLPVMPNESQKETEKKRTTTNAKKKKKKVIHTI